jgi:hypothetical protein
MTRCAGCNRRSAVADRALWNLSTGRWLHLPAPSGHPGLAAAPVWAGTELLALTGAGHLLAFRR